MASRRERSQPAASDGWIALGWAAVAVVAVVVAQWLALPANRPAPFHLSERGDFWRPEWLIAAGLVCGPVFWCAQRCWWLAVPLVALVSAQLVFIVGSGVAVLREAGLAGTLDGGWYAVGGLEILVCLVAAGRGAARNLAHRRWVRTMVALLPDLADAGRSDREQGFSAAG